MKYALFDSLKQSDAQGYLDAFLEFGKSRGFSTLEESVHFTVELDFRLESIPIVLNTLVPKLKTIPKEMDLTLPEFIRNTETYKNNLFEFDQKSNYLVLAAAYYLGESFIRNYSFLFWSIGSKETIHANMPVVSGFRFNELPPLVIVENLFRGIVSRMKDDTAIDVMINAWKTNAEQ